MKDTIVVVSGIPRSGTSMIMNMLQAGGMAVVTDRVRKADEDNPRGYFEDERVKNLKQDSDWLDQVRGRAVKVVSQLLPNLPGQYGYKILFVTRDLDEVLASQRKMYRRRHKAEDDTPDWVLKQAFEKHLEKTREWLAGQGNMEVLYVDFRDVLDVPAEHAGKIRDFLSIPMDVEAMASAVAPELYRSRRGLDGFRGE